MQLNDAEQGAALTVAAFTLVGMLGAMIIKIISLSNRFTRIEFQVETMWAFQMRRAQSEAVHKGYAYRNSPLLIKESSKDLMLPLASELRGFYRSLKKPMTDSELAMLIESQFGERLLIEVCIPNGLVLGACLPIAIAVAKGTDTVNLT